MKKLLLVVALICIAFNVSAQDDSKITIKAGVGIGNVVGSEADGCETALAYKIGAGYEFALSEKFAIEPSLMLSNKSFKIEGISGTIDRFFIEVPVLAAYKFALNDNLNLVINAGPYLAYGLYGSDILYYDGSKENVFDSFERFEFGVEAGVKVAFDNIYIGADFSRALSKASDDYKQYSQCFGLTFGYKF